MGYGQTRTWLWIRIVIVAIHLVAGAAQRIRFSSSDMPAHIQSLELTAAMILYYVIAMAVLALYLVKVVKPRWAAKWAPPAWGNCFLTVKNPWEVLHLMCWVGIANGVGMMAGDFIAMGMGRRMTILGISVAVAGTVALWAVGVVSRRLLPA